ncbi:MAG: hypothetical protein ACFFD6_05385 [Candidatus Thorarchaeota archaeon]
MGETSDVDYKRPCEEVLSDPNRGKLEFNGRAIARRLLGFLRVSSPFLTAHHPFCEHFSGHVFIFRGRQWCIGCFFNTLSFVTTSSVLLLLWSIAPLTLSRFYLFWGGIAGVVVSFLASAFHLNENFRAKAISKLLLGSSFASVTISVLIVGGSLLEQLLEKVLFIALLYLPTISLMNAKRLREITVECEECEYRMRWSKCPGFKDLVCRMVDEGYIVANPKPVGKNDSQKVV